MNNQIKNALLSAAFAAASLSPTKAAIIAYDGFNYTSGTQLGTNTAPAEFTGWVTQNSNNPGYQVNSGSLAYTGLQTSGNSAGGGSIYTVSGLGINLSNSAWTPYKAGFTNQYSGTTQLIGAANTTLYLSFLMSAATDTSEYALNTDNFHNANPLNAGFLNAGVSLTPSGGVTLNTNSFTSGTYDTGPRTAQSVTGLSGNAGVNLFVLKLQFVAGVGDVVSLFLNPTVGAAEGTPTASITTTGDLAFNNANWYAGYNPGMGKLDEIRFGTTFADVTPVPEPSTYAMLLLGAGALILFRRRRVV